MEERNRKMVTPKSETPFDLVATLAEFDKRGPSLSATEFELLADFCAKWFLNYIGELSPIWSRMIEAAREETRLDAWRLLGAWTVRTLERAQHIDVPSHPLFEAQLPRMVETQCSICQKTFMPTIGGQKYCSNPCGIKAAKLAAQ